MNPKVQSMFCVPILTRHTSATSHQTLLSPPDPESPWEWLSDLLMVAGFTYSRVELSRGCLTILSFVPNNLQVPPSHLSIVLFLSPVDSNVYTLYRGNCGDSSVTRQSACCLSNKALTTCSRLPSYPYLCWLIARDRAPSAVTEDSSS